MNKFMNKYRFTFLSALSALSFATYTNALADNDIYGRVDLGIGIPSGKVENKQPFYKNSGNKSFNNAFTYSVGVGYKINECFRGDLTYNRVDNLKYSVGNKNDKNSDKNSNNNKASDGRKFEQKVNLQSAMVNLYYDLPTKQTFVPYLGAGVGYAKINPGVATTTTEKTKTVIYDKGENTNGFSYALMAGIAYNINEQFSIDLGYKFQNYGKNSGMKSFEIYNNGKKNDLMSKDYKDDKKNRSFKMQMHSVNVGIRYTF